MSEIDDLVAPYPIAQGKTPELTSIFRARCQLENTVANALRPEGSPKVDAQCDKATPPAGATLEGENDKFKELRQNVDKLTKAMVPFSA